MSPSFGVSFSAPYAQHLKLDPVDCLQAALEDMGIKRLRLMSYWSRLEPSQGTYDWSELDWQIDLAEKYGSDVTLCLGLRQPRWPESHWPAWAKELPVNEWHAQLADFITATVKRYKGRACIVSYQLENEALNRSFGENGDFNVERLKRELKLVKQLDPVRPVIMTTSNSWGIPWREPRPDKYGFSIYRYYFKNGKYRQSRLPASLIRLRAATIWLIQRKQCFIHELQAEPWGPRPVPEMDLKEQYKSIDPLRVKQAIDFAVSTGMGEIDIWGMEWWYYLRQEHGSSEVWDYIKSLTRQQLGVS